MNEPKNYYQLLNVDAKAGSREIRHAYVRLAKELHPDVGGTQAQMEQLNVAYQTLSNTLKRKAYDKVIQLHIAAESTHYKDSYDHSTSVPNSITEMTDSELDDFINSIHAEIRSQSSDVGVHKRAVAAVKDTLKRARQKRSKM